MGLFQKTISDAIKKTEGNQLDTAWVILKEHHDKHVHHILAQSVTFKNLLDATRKYQDTFYTDAFRHAWGSWDSMSDSEKKEFLEVTLHNLNYQLSRIKKSVNKLHQLNRINFKALE